MKHVRVISLSALLVACSSIALDGENAGLGKGDRDDKLEDNADAGARNDEGKPAEGNDGEEAATDEDLTPESTIVGSEEELDALIAASSAGGEAIGGVELRLIDAPVEADAVNVTFCGVQVHLLMTGERSSGERDPMAPMGLDAGAAVGSRVEPPPAQDMRDTMMVGAPPSERQPSEPSMEGETPPPEGTVPPRDRMAPPADEMRPPPEGEASMREPMRPPPEGEMRPIEPLPDDREVFVDGGPVGEERPLPMRPEMVDGGAPPPPPDRLPLLDGGAPEPVDMRAPVAVGETPPGHWLGVGETCVTVDLLALQGGVFEGLGFAALPVGNYGQIRLNLTDAEVVVDGVVHPLTVPSSEESGLKIEGGFTVEDGEVTTLTVDFDAARSVEQTGNGDYSMKPVIFLAGAERRVVRPPQPGAAPGDIRDMSQATAQPMDPNRDSAATDAPPRSSADPSKPMDERPPTEERMPPPDQPEGEPAASGRGEATAPPAQSAPPRDMPAPSGSVPPEGERPAPPPPEGGGEVPAEREPPPPLPEGSAPPASSLPLPPPPRE